MSSLSDACEALKEFALNSKELTDIYGDGDLGKILYGALLLKERKDGFVGFGPRDIWNTSNEDFITLIQKLQEDVRVQSQNK